MDKLILILIEPAIDGCHHLVERVLQNVVGNIFVLHHRKDISIYLVAMTSKKGFKTSIITILIGLYQLIIRECAHVVNHKTLRFWGLETDSSAPITMLFWLILG